MILPAAVDKPSAPLPSPALAPAGAGLRSGPAEAVTPEAPAASGRVRAARVASSEALSRSARSVSRSSAGCSRTEGERVLGVSVGVAVADVEVHVLADPLGPQGGGGEARAHREEVRLAAIACGDDRAELHAWDAHARQREVVARVAASTGARRPARPGVARVEGPRRWSHIASERRSAASPGDASSPMTPRRGRPQRRASGRAQEARISPPTPSTTTLSRGPARRAT